MKRSRLTPIQESQNPYQKVAYDFLKNTVESFFIKNKYILWNIKILKIMDIFIYDLKTLE